MVLAIAAVGSFAMTTSVDMKAQLPKELSRVHTGNGQFVAYIRREAGNNSLGHVWLENLTEQKRWRLTKEPRPFVGLTFTPDGKSLTFLSRESGSDIVATFDINFKLGLASVYYNQLTFEAGQVVAMPMWLDEDKLAYLSQGKDKEVSLMQWSSSRGKHEVLRKYISKSLDTSSIE